MLKQTAAMRLCTIDDFGVSSDSGVSGIKGIANGNTDGTNGAEFVLLNSTTSDL